MVPGDVVLQQQPVATEQVAGVGEDPPGADGGVELGCWRHPGPAQTLVVEWVGCPAIGKVRAEFLTAWAQLMEALVAERRPDRPVAPIAGTAAVGAVVHLLATVIEEGRDLSSVSG